MIDFSNYNPDYFYLSLGGGIQSSTIAEMIAAEQLPPPNLILFADTGDEPQYVYDQVEYLSYRLKHITPIQTVSAGNMIHDLYHRKRFAAIPLFTNTTGKAGRMRRQCTREYKIDPIIKTVKQDLLSRDMAHRDGRGIIIHEGYEIHNWLGISLDEVQRMKPSKDWWCTSIWPLIDLRMSRHDCIKWLTDHKLPIPHKSSCRICPFHDDKHWRNTRDNHTDDWQHCVQLDHDLRDPNNTLKIAATAKGDLFLHRSLLPLGDVDLRTQEERGQLSLFNQQALDICDSGNCWT